MAIKKPFGGSTIRKPGAYSISSQDLSGGAELGDNGILFLVGEAEKGAPGATEGLAQFFSTQLPQLIAEFGDGSLVDMAKNALVPGGPGLDVSGYDRVIVWKTNLSLKAQLELDNASATVLFTLKDRNFGEAGNQIAATIVNGTNAATQRQITIERGDLVEILPENAGTDQLDILYTGAGTAATMTISGLTEDQKIFTTTVTAGPGGEDFTLNLKDFTIKTLQEFIDTQAGYTAVLANTATGAFVQAKELDPQTAVDIKTGPAVDMRRLQRELADIINDQSTLALVEIKPNVEGIPVALVKTLFAGGAKGASANSDFTTGLAKSLATVWNVAIPGISRDATEDITDGLTDPTSAYTIASVTAALETHLRLRGNVKNRKEAQGMLGRRDAVVQTSYDAASSLGSELIQMWIQDVLVQGVDGNLAWKQPHVLAALMAGIRLGTEVAEPLTHKTVNVSGIGHVVNTVTGISAGDFDPDTDFDVAIIAGVSSLEQLPGQRRCVVDNTTYGKDASFLNNRGSVIESKQFVEKSLRETADLVFVGNKSGAKNKGVSAKSIKTVLRQKLIELNDSDITAVSDDAPLGFRDDASFVVLLSGNAATVQVHYKPVQGVDFVFFEFTTGETTQSA